MSGASSRIVLAYSGDLEASAAIPWLQEHRRAEVVTVTMDLGQTQELEAVRDRALRVGAIRAHILDLREPFVRDFIVPALNGGAIHLDRHPTAVTLGWMAVARYLVQVAEIEGVAVVAHGGGGAPGHPHPLDVALRALRPELSVVAPANEWNLSRTDRIRYLNAHGVFLPPAAEAYRVRTTVWGRSIVCDHVETGRDRLEQAYTLTQPVEKCPDVAALVDVTFSAGVPSAVNGVSMPLLDLIPSLNTIAGVHGIGRHQVHPAAGSISGQAREFLEAPAATVLHAAHRELKALVAPGDSGRLASVSQQYADIICSGLWFTPEREALDAIAGEFQERATGVIRLRLFKGSCTVVGQDAADSRSPALAGQKTSE